MPPTDERVPGESDDEELPPAAGPSAPGPSFLDATDTTVIRIDDSPLVLPPSVDPDDDGLVETVVDERVPGESDDEVDASELQLFTIDFLDGCLKTGLIRRVNVITQRVNHERFLLFATHAGGSHRHSGQRDATDIGLFVQQFVDYLRRHMADDDIVADHHGVAGGELGGHAVLTGERKVVLAGEWHLLPPRAEVGARGPAILGNRNVS